MFFGKQKITVSEHNQISLPGRFERLGGGDVFLTRGFDHNLMLMLKDSFETLVERLQEMSLSDPLARQLNRLLLAGAVESKVDMDGRLELPDELAGYASLEKEIILVGQGEYLELWAPELWENQVKVINEKLENGHSFEKFNICLD